MYLKTKTFVVTTLIHLRLYKTARAVYKMCISLGKGSREISAESEPSQIVLIGNRLDIPEHFNLPQIREFERNSQSISERDIQELEFSYKKHSSSNITVIASIFRSDYFILNFLENLDKQTIRDRVELVIVSIQPSTYEQRILNRYEKSCENIKVFYENERLSIYQAWNKAIRESDASIITNWNVDDLRRNDSLEKQVAVMEQFPSIDVSYQDFFVYYEPNLSWRAIEESGQLCRTTNVTFRNLMHGLNSPHNAPVWRRSLHRDLGYFDETLKSAGDYEFWFRATLQGKHFLRSRDPHVGYYLNPYGISTSSDSIGPQETFLVQEKYRQLVNKKVFANMPILPKDYGFLPYQAADRITTERISEIRNLLGTELK